MEVWGDMKDSLIEKMKKILPSKEVTDEGVEFLAKNWYKMIIPCVGFVLALKTRIGTIVSNKLRNALLEFLDENNIEGKIKRSHNIIRVEESEEEITFTMEIQDSWIPDGAIDEKLEENLIATAKAKLDEHTNHFPENGVANIFVTADRLPRFVNNLRTFQ